ncbi:MAG: tetratricopeptide repeat protein [Planctomycetes bacterium]|nr:tetratricopeptide repeat protein [Planctomycetota bacterium]
MRRAILTVLWLGACAATPAASQDDYDLANALADRGWFDLAEELFQGIQNTASLQPDKRAEGAYGLARIKSMQAERETDPKKKAVIYDGAINAMREFITAHPNHRRRNEAYSDIGYLYQQKGKSLMSDHAKSDQAEAAFGEAEKLFLELISSLKGKRPERPEMDGGGRKPAGFDEKMAAFEDWEQRMMFAKYNYGISLFSHAETYRDKPEKFDEMKRILEDMVKYFEEDFMWDFEQYILAYDAFIYMGRAYQLLAETARGAQLAKAEDYWKKCFNFIGKAKSLMAEKSLRANEGVREVALRATYYEMKARTAYGETRKGGAAAKQFIEAAKLAEDLLKYYPNARVDEMGRIIRIEQGRAYFKAGQIDKGRKVLEEIKKECPDTPLADTAIEIISEFVGDTDIGVLVAYADSMLDTGGVKIFTAIAKYRRALTSIRRREDEPFIPHCWYRLGECYFELDRYWEAAAACSMLEKAPYVGTPLGGKAALHKLASLQKIKDLTKQKPDADAYATFLDWATNKYPKEVGGRGIRQSALELEKEGREKAAADKYGNEFEQAAQKWLTLAKDPGSPFYGEALFTAGLDWYFHARELSKAAKTESDGMKASGVSQKAMEQFSAYLAWYRRQPLKDDKYLVHNAVGAIQISMAIHLNSKFTKDPKAGAEAALKISETLDKEFPSGDPVNLMKMFTMRIEAKLDLDRVEEAGEDIKALETRYEKSGLGMDSYVRALVLMALAFEKQAARIQAADPQKAETFMVRSGNYYYKVFLLDQNQFKSAKLDVIAGMLYRIADQKMKQAQKTGDKSLAAEAVTSFDQARDLYQQFRLTTASTLTPEQDTQILSRIITCTLQAGKFGEARKLIEEITGRDPERRRGWAWAALADSYIIEARPMPPSAQRVDLFKKADQIFAELISRLQGVKRDENFWELTYKRAEVLFEYAPEELLKFFQIMDVKGYGQTWDDGTWGFKEKFESLRAKLNARTGGGQK